MHTCILLVYLDTETNIGAKIMKIQLKEVLQSAITDGSRDIPAGTVMEKYFSQLQWTYFKGDGFTLVIMGFGSDDWNKVKKID